MADIVTSPDLQIYTGSWTDWSRGRVLGATITISQRSGNFLIAFVALFVAFTGTCAFRLACFGFHRALSRSTTQDGVYHQRQAILRNSANGVTAVWELCQMLWYWRHSNQRVIRRLLPLALYITVSVICFGAAGILSSNIAVMTGDEVLLTKSPYCGENELDPNVTIQELTSISASNLARSRQSMFNYAQDCYSTRATQGRCDGFIKPNLLTSSTSFDASCPFNSSICRTQNKNVKLDTGLINAQSDLGVNAPGAENVFFRRLMHCGPIIAEGFKETTNSSTTPMINYLYGPQIVNGEVRINETYVHKPVEGDLIGYGGAREYELAMRMAEYLNGSLTFDAQFQPIKPLQRTDARTFLIFLSANGIVYNRPVDDPWYSAHVPNDRRIESTSTSNSTTMLYNADEAASPLACAIQYQTCFGHNPSGRQCSPLSGGYDLQQFNFTQLSVDQSMQAKRLLNTFLKPLDFEAFIVALASGSLMSKYTLFQGMQTSLPDNQWQLDVQRWHNATMAAIQTEFVATAVGLEAPLREIYNVVKDPYTETLCANQKVRSARHANFSVLGLSIIIALGVIIIVANYMLESDIIGWFLHLVSSKRRNKVSYHKLEWQSNGTLQLQRMAHEEAGFGTWRNCDCEVPVTKPGDRLAELDLRYPMHPRFKAMHPATSSNKESLSLHGVSTCDSQSAPEADAKD